MQYALAGANDGWFYFISVIVRTWAPSAIILSNLQFTFAGGPNPLFRGGISCLWQRIRFFSYCACRCKRYAQINSNEEGFSVLFDIMAREREWCISRLQTQGIRGLYIYLSNSCFLIRNWTRCTLSKGLVFVAIFNIILKIITQLLLLLLRNLRQWRNLKIFSLVFSFLCDLEQLLSLLFFSLWWVWSIV